MYQYCNTCTVCTQSSNIQVLGPLNYSNEMLLFYKYTVQYTIIVHMTRSIDKNNITNLGYKNNVMISNSVGAKPCSYTCSW